MKAALQVDAGDAQGDGRGRVGVDHGLHIRALTVGFQVQEHLAGGVQIPGRAIAAAHRLHIPVDDDELIRLDQPLAEARRRTQKTVLVQPGADIAVRGGHKTLLPQHPAHLDDLLAQLLLGLADDGFVGGLGSG